MAQAFSTTVTETFQETVNSFGHSFGVDKQSIDVFSESFIRSHLIFQMAKALETQHQMVRNSLQLPPMTLISLSSSKLVSGTVMEVSDLTSNSNTFHGQSVVFLQRADGTEEIPNGITAIVLKHQVPQLSHLAIRAR